MRATDKLSPGQSSHPIGIGIECVNGEGNVDGYELTFGYRF